MTEITENDSRDENDAQSGPNWEDPSVAVGNAPPMAGWPLVVSILAWAGGIVFLLMMMAERLS